jgi:transposase InsO family protein
VFTGRFRRGRVALELTLHHRGVVFLHSRPDHPQTCGKVERVHQTVKKHLATRPRARTLTQFRAYYNTERPHRALHRQTPQQAYGPDPKPPAPGSH